MRDSPKGDEIYHSDGEEDLSDDDSLYFSCDDEEIVTQDEPDNEYYKSRDSVYSENYTSRDSTDNEIDDYFCNNIILRLARNIYSTRNNLNDSFFWYSKAGGCRPDNNKYDGGRSPPPPPLDSVTVHQRSSLTSCPVISYWAEPRTEDKEPPPQDSVTVQRVSLTSCSVTRCWMEPRTGDKD